jgi:hypothetical protein
MSLFIIFLLRHKADPIPGFAVPFHSDHMVQLSLLRDILHSDDLLKLSRQIHSVVLSTLMNPGHKALLSDHKDLFTLFPLSYHLKDDSGNMTRVSAIPPNISAIQWCLRATIVREISEKATLYDGDTFQYILVSYQFLLLTSQSI